MFIALAFMFIQIEQEHGIPAGLLASICYVESKWDVNAIHHDDGKTNSIGLCQTKLATAKDLGFIGTEADLLNPVTNAKYAAKYLKHQIKRYHGDLAKIGRAHV